MKKMTRVFREAARLIAQDENQGQYACAALWRAQGEQPSEFGRHYNSPAHGFLNDLFLPNRGYFCANGDDDEAFMQEFGCEGEGVDAPAAHDRRVLALLLLAAMSEAGDL